MNGRKARRRRSAHEVKAVVAYLRTALAHLPDVGRNALPPVGHYPSVELYTLSDLRRAADRVEDLSRDAAAVLERCVRQLRARGRFRRLIVAPPPAVLEPLSSRFPHFRAVIQFIAEQLALATLEPRTALHLPPILLDGDPGVGKTHFAHRLASVLGVPFHEIGLGSATAGFVLGGLDLGWATGQPGKVHHALVEGSYANPMLLLDELDKVNNHTNFDVHGPLYALLEPGTAARFADEAVQVPMNAAHIVWLATCNTLVAVPQPIVSRFTVFTVPLPTRAEGAQIAQGVYADLRARHRWGPHFAPALAPEVLDAVAAVAPRELIQVLRRAAGRAALARRRTIQPNDLETPKLRPFGFY